jgi:hypothetical protein
VLLLRRALPLALPLHLATPYDNQHKTDGSDRSSLSLSLSLSVCAQRGGWEGTLPASAAIGHGWEKTTLVNSENYFPPVNGFPSAYICKNARKKYF